MGGEADDYGNVSGFIFLRGGLDCGQSFFRQQTAAPQHLVGWLGNRGDDAAALRPLVPVVCLVFCVTCEFFFIPPATSGGYSQRRQDCCLE